MDSSLLQRRLLYVTGKGGVGKTTVAAALGVAAASRGMRTIVCEVADQDHVASAFGTGGDGREEVQLDERLWATSIDPTRALEEWLGRQLGSQTLVRTLGRAQAFQYFIAAAPGARELITIGKVFDLVQRRADAGADSYDLVIVDAPASGHGVGMLKTPQTFGEIARVGTVRRQAHKIRALLSDPDRTAYLAVAVAEESPVNETLELESQIEQAVGVGVHTVIVNRLAPERFSPNDAARLRAALDDGHDAAAAGMLRAALSGYELACGQREHLKRLRDGTRAQLLTLPELTGDARGLEGYRSLGTLLARDL
jgi:anion-transporting  ArsA/GET3 family ATPase